MLKKLKFVFFPAALLFCVVSFTGAYFSDSVTTSGNTFTAGVSSDTDVIINEIFANPSGAENAPMPGGEWVELYNTGDWSIDVNGWYLYDSYDNHALPVNAANVAGGSTLIPSGGYLVVFRNGDADFSLNNDDDTVRLFNDQIGLGTLIDSQSYINPDEDKTWSGMPNGLGAWSDNHTPTPGGANA